MDEIWTDLPPFFKKQIYCNQYWCNNSPGIKKKAILELINKILCTFISKILFK